MALWPLATLRKMSPVHHDHFLGLEDYKLGGRNQYVSYQIAEVGGITKHELTVWGLPFTIINPRKRMSYVRMTKSVDKNVVMAWAADQGFQPPVKTRGRAGYDKRQREDLADAYVLARMARDLYGHLQEASVARRGDIFLDREYGLAYRSDLLFNIAARS